MKTSCRIGSTISLNHLTRMSIFMVIRAQLTHIISKVHSCCCFVPLLSLYPLFPHGLLAVSVTYAHFGLFSGESILAVGQQQPTIFTGELLHWPYESEQSVSA